MAGAPSLVPSKSAEPAMRKRFQEPPLGVQVDSKDKHAATNGPCAFHDTGCMESLPFAPSAWAKRHFQRVQGPQGMKRFD